MAKGIPKHGPRVGKPEVEKIPREPLVPQKAHVACMLSVSRGFRSRVSGKAAVSLLNAATRGDVVIHTSVGTYKYYPSKKYKGDEPHKVVSCQISRKDGKTVRSKLFATFVKNGDEWSVI